MMRAMLWKEYREHRIVWLALAVVAALALVGLSRLMAPGGLDTGRGAREMLMTVAVLMAWTYGLVCGSILLAGEREGDTLPFLDILPVRRLRLWALKCLIGVGLLLGQVIVLVGLVAWLDVAPNRLQAAALVVAMLLGGLVGLGWGLLFSARGENVLNTIGLAIAGQFACSFVVGFLSIPGQMIFSAILPASEVLKGCVILLVALALTIGPFVVSARIFSQPDRLRRFDVVVPLLARTSVAASWGRLIWLSYRQMKRLALGLTAFALLGGFLLPIYGLAAWSSFTLLIGVLCGVTACADEQTHGSFRFLGDQRFPLGRIWLVQVGTRFSVAVAATIVLLLPSLIGALYEASEHSSSLSGHTPWANRVLHSSLADGVIPLPLFLPFGLVYGFSVGHLSGLLFRKSLVAGVVALGLSLLLASVWMVSLLGIGLHAWQVMGVPVILLVTARLLVPAWVADRLVARGTFIRLGVAGLACGLWIGAGLWYRVAEIPDVPEPPGLDEFVRSIPTVEHNEAGLLCRAAFSQVKNLERSENDAQAANPGAPGAGPNPPRARAVGLSQVSEVLRHGWPARQPEWDRWLDKRFAEPWAKDLAKLPDLPLGVIDDPRRMNIGSTVSNIQGARTITTLLAARGLQQQARGDSKTFVDNLRIGLALSRNLRHRAPSIDALVGRAIEAVWWPALDRWLEKLDGQPELLRRALDILVKHEAELPAATDQLLAEYLIARNTLDEIPDRLLKQSAPPTDRIGDDPRYEAEIETAALAWRVPWEQERHRRILRLIFQGDREQQKLAFRSGGPALASLALLGYFRGSNNTRLLAQRHAAQLKVALRLYQAENGKPAPTLAVLVGRYLDAVPLDPFDGQPFRYRLSAGERIGWPDEMAGAAPAVAPRGVAPQAPPGAGPGGGAPAGPMLPGMVPPGGMVPPLQPARAIPAGQGILWCVGEDGQDDGGHAQGPLAGGATSPGEDLIFLVPLPPRK